MADSYEIERRFQNLATRINSSFHSPALDRMDGTLQNLQTVIDRIIRNIDPEKLEVNDINDIYKLGNALSGIYRARTEAEKLRIEVESAHEKASDALIEMVRLRLEKDEPELFIRLGEIVHGTKKQLIEAKGKKAKK